MNVLGDYILLKTMILSLAGQQEYTVLKGSIIVVKGVNEVDGLLKVEIGPAIVAWISASWLRDMEKLI
jgi:hypothetical protein